VSITGEEKSLLIGGDLQQDQTQAKWAVTSTSTITPGQGYPLRRKTEKHELLVIHTWGAKSEETQYEKRSSVHVPAV